MVVKIFSHYPYIRERNVKVFFSRVESNRLIDHMTLTSFENYDVEVPVEENRFTLEIFCDLTWIPKLITDSTDERELGIGLSNVQIK
jgi:hypothetical protein